MDSKETADMLSQVNAAISAILVGGQSYKIGSRTLTRANITELKKLREELMAQKASCEDNGLVGDTYVAVFDRR